VLVVHGETRSVRLTQVTRFPGDAATYGCALDLERPADLVGDIVAGRAGFLAHTAGGLVPLDARGRALPAIPVPGVAQGARLFASETDGGASRAVFWLESESAVLVVDPVARTHHRVALPRERDPVVGAAREDPASVLAVLPGPRVLHRPSARVHALLDVSTPAGGESIEYALPAFSGDRTDRRLRVSEEGVLEEAGQRLVAWSVDGYAGLLDLETGRSTGVEVGFPANVRALFREPGAGRTVMVVDRGLPPDSALVLLTAPSLSAR
jgi:hypothetical protein